MVALVAAIAVAILVRGAFFPLGQSLFVATAGFAFTLAVLEDEKAVLRSARSAPVAILALLGLTAAASATWTIGRPSEAVRAGFVMLGLAALAAASGALSQRPARFVRLAWALAAIAGIAAVEGLAGVVLRQEPWAERIDGAWRPGGPFEYPPALALLQVSALPALLLGMTGPRARVAMASALGGSLAAVTIALSDSRMQVALAGILLVVAVWGSRSALGVTRSRAAGAAAALLGAGMTAHLALGGYAAPGVIRGAGPRALACLLAIALGMGVWLALSRWAGGRATSNLAVPASRPRARLLVPTVLGVAVLVTTAFTVGPPVAGDGDLTHGRLQLWADALTAWEMRPVLGSGAGTFLLAVSGQGDAVSLFAHSLPLEMAVELGLGGLLLIAGLYVTCASVTARVRDARRLWLFAPAMVAFLLTNLVDWEWRLAGSAAVFAISLGALVAGDHPEDA